MPPLERRRRDACRKVLQVTALPADFSAGSPAKAAVCGYLLDARRMLEALLILGANDKDDTGDGLARSAFEHAITAGWLAEDLSRLEILKGAYDSDWIDVRENWVRRHPGETSGPYDDLELLLPREDGAKPVRLPKIWDRTVAAGLEDYFGPYKLLCMSVHGTLAAASAGLDPAPRQNLRPARFSLTASMVLKIARRVDALMDLGWEPRLVAAETMVVAVFQEG